MTDHEKIKKLTDLIEILLFGLWSNGAVSEEMHNECQRILAEMEVKQEPHPVGSHDRQGDWL